MSEALQRLFDHMGGREAYDRFRQANPEMAAKIEAVRTREFDQAEDRPEAEDAKYINKSNPHKYIATWMVIKGWAHDIDWWLAHSIKEG